VSGGVDVVRNVYTFFLSVVKLLFTVFVIWEVLNFVKRRDYTSLVAFIIIASVVAMVIWTEGEPLIAIGNFILKVLMGR
jgi:hypothetical protein